MTASPTENSVASWATQRRGRERSAPRRRALAVFATAMFFACSDPPMEVSPAQVSEDAVLATRFTLRGLNPQDYLRADHRLELRDDVSIEVSGVPARLFEADEAGIMFELDEPLRVGMHDLHFQGMASYVLSDAVEVLGGVGDGGVDGAVDAGLDSGVRPDSGPPFDAGVPSDGGVGDADATLDPGPDASVSKDDVFALGAGEWSTYWISEDRHLYGFGRNNRGQLALAGGADRLVATLMDDSMDWEVATGGQEFFCGLASGEAFCAGANDGGQLGRGDRVDSPMLDSLRRRGTGWNGLALGAEHACAFNNDSAVCWGSNRDERLDIGSSPLFATQPQSRSDMMRVANAFHDKTCSLHRGAETEHMHCIGWQGYTGRIDMVPESVCVGEDHGCAVAGGNLYCWGANQYGQLGLGFLLPPMGYEALETFDNLSPLSGQVDMDKRWREVACGTHHTCAIETGGALHCWGRNAEGQLGTGDNRARAFPVLVAGLGSTSQVVTGSHHTCAIAEGEVYCWGDNRFGQLGQGNRVPSTLPEPVSLP